MAEFFRGECFLFIDKTKHKLKTLCAYALHLNNNVLLVFSTKLLKSYFLKNNCDVDLMKKKPNNN